MKKTEMKCIRLLGSLSVFGGLAFSLCLAACGTHVSGGDPSGVLPPNSRSEKFENAVPGPSLNGEWVSGCVNDKWASDYITFDMTVSGASVTRTETRFSDSACTIKVKQTIRTGLFRYKDYYSSSGVYEVEYKFNLGRGGSYRTGENLQLKANGLWISDRYVGPSVTPDIQLVAKKSF